MDSEDDIPPFPDPCSTQVENCLSNPAPSNLAAHAPFHRAFLGPYMMPENNNVWNSMNDLGNLTMVTAPFETAPPNYINNRMPNGIDFSGYCDASVPRGRMATDQIQDLLNTTFPDAGNIEPRHLGNTSFLERGQEEAEYATNATTTHVAKRIRKSSNVSSEDWLKWKPELEKLYINEGYSLPATMTRMAVKGFHAE
jgi:hypothetical protein